MDDTDNALKMQQLAKLEFPILADPGGGVVKKYGVYNLLGDGVAAPATFIIDRQGIIRWRYIGQGIADRPTADALANQARQVLAVP